MRAGIRDPIKSIDTHAPRRVVQDKSFRGSFQKTCQTLWMEAGFCNLSGREGGRSTPRAPFFCGTTAYRGHDASLSARLDR